MENIERTKKVIRISLKKTIIGAVVLVVVATVALVLYQMYEPRYYNITSSVNDFSERVVDSEYSEIVYPDYYPMPSQNPSSIKDTREFLKTSYSAFIKTRNVKNVLRDVKSIIREADGRIDTLNETPQNGYVRFVVPKSNFENFKDEIESITHEKLITENISSENLLGQKQSIEEQNRNATASLITLEKQQKDLTAKHTQTINKLQADMTNYTNQLIYVRSLISSTYDEALLNSLRIQETNLSQSIDSLKQSINSENSNFNTNNQNLKYEIESMNKQLKYIAEQNTNFTNNIETVNGSISVQWVSLWKLVKILSPVSPVIIIIILVIIILYLLKRKNYIPKIEFV